MVKRFMTAQSTVATWRRGVSAIVTLAAMAALAPLTADAVARQARPAPTSEAKVRPAPTSDALARVAANRALARGFDQATDVSCTLSYRVAMVVPDLTSGLRTTSGNELVPQ